MQICITEQKHVREEFWCPIDGGNNLNYVFPIFRKYIDAYPLQDSYFYIIQQGKN